MSECGASAMMSEPTEAPKCDHVVGYYDAAGYPNESSHLVHASQQNSGPSESFDYCPKCGTRLTPIGELIDASYTDSDGRPVRLYVEGLAPKDPPA